MLLKTNGRTKSERGYPTMSMIMNALLEGLRRSAYYYQHDSLWKSLKIASRTAGTHDVYNQKRLSLKG